MSKVISALICSGLLATPALADFYVVQDTSTKRCTIVEEKPASTTTVVVGGGSVYTSRTEAEGAMKSIEVCSSGTTTGSTTTTTTTTKQ